jgi:hypothetical protein
MVLEYYSAVNHTFFFFFFALPVGWGGPIYSVKSTRTADDRSAQFPKTGMCSASEDPGSLLGGTPAGEPKVHPKGLLLFLDLDGVLADFDDGVRAALHAAPDTLAPSRMWPALARVPGGFFSSLAPMPDAAALWTHCAAYRPRVLTGLPMGTWAEPQKRDWCARHLSRHVTVITCLARDKYKHCSRGSVLVDDREENRDAWVRAGGTFVLHKSAALSIKRLRELGFV